MVSASSKSSCSGSEMVSNRGTRSNGRAIAYHPRGTGIDARVLYIKKMLRILSIVTTIYLTKKSPGRKTELYLELNSQPALRLMWDVLPLIEPIKKKPVAVTIL